jgi:small subunit ribosomal protein S3
MAKKVNPKVFRLGMTRTWPSKWFSDGKPYIAKLQQDLAVRRYLINTYKEAGVDRVEIERHSDNKITIILYTAKPGMLIGRGGSGIDDLKKKLHDKFLKKFRLNEISLNVNEVARPNLSAMILVQSMILDIEKRMPFKRVMKQTINKAERAGGLGIKVTVGGRLNGSEIARSESLSSGKLPLQTLRADIDYAAGTAHTTYGAIGIKVWIYKGEIFERAEDKGDVVRAKNK